jgi:toxin ParE1/3/4
LGDYRLAPAAVRDLEAIWQYTNEQWGADQATDYTDQ